MNRAELESRLKHRVDRDPLLRQFREASGDTGVRSWLVGGAVRDTALGLRIADLDFSAGRTAAKLVGRLQRVWSRRGFRFRKRGVTTWRFEVAGRKVDIVDAGYRGIDRDLRRRDFTVNAIAFDLMEARLLDPYGGLRDLRRGLLALPSAAVMRADPLRTLRAARFLAQLPGFRLHREARREAERVARRVQRVAAERIREELDRLLESPDPRRGLGELERLGLLPHTLPELLPLKDCAAGAGRPDVWTHTLDTIDASARAARLPAAFVLRDRDERRVVRWSLLLHDVCKPDTFEFRPDGRPAFHGHEELGAKRADAVLRRLRAPRALRLRVRRLVRHHLRPGHLADAGAPPRGMRRLVRDAAGDLPLLVFHAACDAKGSGSAEGPARWRRLRTVLLDLLRLHERTARRGLPRLVTGADVLERLRIPAGPEVGRLLERVRTEQEEGRLRNRADALRFLDDLRRRHRRDCSGAPR